MSSWWPNSFQTLLRGPFSKVENPSEGFISILHCSWDAFKSFDGLGWLGCVEVFVPPFLQNSICLCTFAALTEQNQQKKAKKCNFHPAPPSTSAAKLLRLFVGHFLSTAGFKTHGPAKQKQVAKKPVSIQAMLYCINTNSHWICSTAVHVPQTCQRKETSFTP